jgi:apolipoprotein D and lipocalin family protein
MKNPLLILGLTAMVAGCTGIPEGVEPVSGFEKDRYLGRWYEIARLDHSFERGLSQVSAEYQLQEDGSIQVINRGYKESSDEWKEAEGRAVFVDSADVGHLKVSFFGPFYSSYVIFELDKEAYSHAYVSGYNRDYLWFLSRTPQVSDAALEDFKATARKAGFDLEELILVEQDQQASD